MDPGKPAAYIEDYDKEREIRFFDLERGIFWEERTEEVGEDSLHLKPIWYWEPKSIWENRDKVVPHLPVWKVTEYIPTCEKMYFDGNHCYYAENYYTFKALDMFGNVYVWSDERDKHGACDSFRVMGDKLFLDLHAYYEAEYELSLEKTPILRKSWFKEELSQEIVAQFKNKSAVSPAPAAPQQEKPVQSNADLVAEKEIGPTDIKYSICTLGAKFHIGFGVPVTVQINGKSYNCKTHTSSKGRIGGMGKVYSKNNIVLGDTIQAAYSAKDNIITLMKK